MTVKRQPRPPGTWTTNAIRKTVTHAYTEDKLNIREIAASIGASYTTVHTILVNAAVGRRARGARRTRTASRASRPSATRATARPATNGEMP